MPVSYECTKCHWKRLNPPEEPEEVESAESALSKTQQSSVSPASVPATAHLSWLPAVSVPLQTPVTAPWPGYQVPLTNGTAHSPQPLTHLPAQQPYLPSPYSQANGYMPLSAPSTYGALQTSAVRSPYPPPQPPHAPAPLHFTPPPQLPSPADGIPSAHVPMQTSSQPGFPVSHRQTESPFSVPPQHLPAYGATHGSPAPMPNRRPSTPRESTTMPTLNGGASASPSLRNLLH